MFNYYDTSMIILIPAMILTMLAQAKVKSNFARYSNVRNHRGMTGAEAARRVLNANGLNNVEIEQVRGSLTDHYDPRTRVLRLSQTVYGATSVAAVSVACHEVGHAIQHAKGYAPLKVRNGIVPVVNFASRMSWPLILMGIVMLGAGSYQMGDTLFNIGVITFAAVVLFHAITLPVEFNASNRALKQMEDLAIIDSEEEVGAKRVLRAAAMTYVAALAMAVANLLRILAIRGRRD